MFSPLVTLSLPVSFWQKRGRQLPTFAGSSFWISKICSRLHLIELNTCKLWTVYEFMKQEAILAHGISKGAFLSSCVQNLINLLWKEVFIWSLPGIILCTKYVFVIWMSHLTQVIILCKLGSYWASEVVVVPLFTWVVCHKLPCSNAKLYIIKNQLHSLTALLYTVR